MTGAKEGNRRHVVCPALGDHVLQDAEHVRPAFDKCHQVESGNLLDPIGTVALALGSDLAFRSPILPPSMRRAWTLSLSRS